MWVAIEAPSKLLHLYNGVKTTAATHTCPSPHTPIHHEEVIELANKEEYDKAAEAVKAGSATPRQKELNARMAKNVGSAGNKARDAYK